MTIQLAYNCHMENCTGFKTDNTPFYIFFGSIIFLVIAACIYEAATTFSRERLLQNGNAANAEIQTITSRKILKEGSVEVDLRLAVTSAEGDVFEAQTNTKFPITELPQVGWTVPVRYSAKDRHRIAVEGAASPPDAFESGESGRP